MKPIHLSVAAFGAFADTVEVDFAALAPRGLFLVSGETGTGKTTIFDAMCWALYGTMPLKESHEVRSDHVDDATRCEVTFTFESGGERYCVTRNPEQLRPAAKNPTRRVKEAAAASLVRIIRGESSDKTDLVAGKVSEVARACEAIIGLDATQFQRVILLPQGEFNKFLLANSGDREKILERLFGGQIYDRIVEELKTVRDACQSEVGDAEAAIAASLDAARSHVAAADTALTPDDGHAADAAVAPNHGQVTDDLPVSKSGGAGDAQEGDSLGHQPGLEVDVVEEPPGRQELDRAVTRLDVTLGQCRSDLAEATEKRAVAQSAHDLATTGAQRFDQAETLRSTLAELDEHAEAVETSRIAAIASAKARPIVEAADALTTAESAHGDATKARDDRRGSITTVLSDLGASAEDLAPVSLQRQYIDLQAAYTADTERLTKQRAADEALSAAQKAREELDTTITKVEAEQSLATCRTAEIDAQLPELRAAAVDPDSIRTEIASAIQLAEDREKLSRTEADLRPASDKRADAASAHRDLLQAFTDTQAPRLAMALEDDRPCPVCGSTEHPAPATSGDAHVVAWDEVIEAGDRHGKADDTVRALEAQINELRGRLGGAATAELTDLRKRVEAQRAELHQATMAATKVAALEQEQSALVTELERLGADVARLTERRAQSDRELTQAADAARDAAEAATGLDPTDLDQRASSLAKIEIALKGYDVLVDAVTSTASLVESRQRELAAHLKDSDHDDLASARSVLWSPEQEQAAITVAEAHRSERDSATGALQALLAAGLPESRPEPTETEMALHRADVERQRLETLVASVSFNVAGATKALARSDQLDAESGDLRARAEVAARAHQVCAKGGPGLSVPLKRWVLAHELDRIAAAANVHLAGMTNGRYGLRRRKAQLDGRRSFGLDLEIDDTNTGRPRSTSSLSGGEQFQASLALALGLADVISHGGTAGGQDFEALFVDEGFGSLSADALDDAVETLHRLHGSGRMVGAITHVEAMKNALHVGIEVTRRDDGRGSTLAVNY